MYEHILVPYDGSDEGKKGAAHGIDLAAALDVTVHGLYVIDLPGIPRTLSIREDEEDLREEYHEYGEEVLDELGEMAADAGVDYESHIRSGSVSEEIVQCANEEDLDAIMMGSGYRGAVGSLIGGKADRVVRTANVPVITRRTQIDEH